MSQTGKSIYCGAMVFVAFSAMRNWVAVSNMLFFFMACSLFVIVTLAAYLLFGLKESDANYSKDKIWSVLPVLSIVLWMILFYINETDAPHPLKAEELVRHYIPFPLWIAAMVTGILICLFILRKKTEKKTEKVRKGIRIFVALLFTAGISVQIYAPNIFLDVQGGTYHSHAYTNSIINTCWLIPYSEHNQALYGHYGIVFMPVLKALHKFFDLDYLTGIFAVSAVVAGISVLIFIWIINYFAKNDLFFYLGMLAIGEYYFMLMQGGVYLQVYPHRMIFPITIIGLALLERIKSRKYDFWAIILITLSIVWSTEVGLVIMVAFTLYRWTQAITDGERFTWKKMLVLLPKLLLFSVIPFVFSYVIVNGYNIIVGGELLDLKEFLFPLISERGYISNIELPLPDVTHAWIGTAILFLSAVCIVGRFTFFPQKDDKIETMPFIFLLGIMSLGLMVYYINRPAEGSLFIIMYLMLVMQVIILQKAQERYISWKEEKQTVFDSENRFLFLSLRVITVFILLVMTFDSVYSMPKAWQTSAETIWKRDELKAFAEQIYVEIPPDAVAFGEGVPELLSIVDRDTHLHTTEWSYLNMPADTMKKVRYDLEGVKWFFCSQESLYYMQLEYPGLTDNYDLCGMLEYAGRQFGFWQIKE